MSYFPVNIFSNLPNRVKCKCMEKKAEKSGVYKTVYKLLIPATGITTVLLLVPSCDKLFPVFGKGEFAYTESIGIIFGFLTVLLVVLYSAVKFFSNNKYFKNLFEKKVPSKYRRTTSVIAHIFIPGIISLLTIFVITLVWIRFDVKTQCQKARAEYGGSCVESLISVLENKNESFRDKNSAVWALGQLADPKALPALQRYYNGNIPERESLYQTLSQYELQKAIKWCAQGNITSWMYGGL